MTALTKAQLVKSLAREVGFDLVGITSADPVRRADYYRDWLERGHHGQMRYLERNVHFRAEPAGLVPGAQSIVCVGLSYGRPGEWGDDAGRTWPGHDAPTGYVSQYARGRDYHLVMGKMLAALVQRLRERLGEPLRARGFVDAAPLLERELAARAGLGWIGKNTCLITSEYGSYVFLGELLTTLKLEVDTPGEGTCGSCTRCMDACPTGALNGPRELDAGRCIAYLTIEHRGVVADDFHAAIGDHVFGCDVCQAVCPYNRGSAGATNGELCRERLTERVNLLSLLGLRSGAYRRLTRGTAGARATRNMWRRNAAIAAGNAAGVGGDVVAVLESVREDADEGVREAARASLRRLSEGDA